MNLSFSKSIIATTLFASLPLAFARLDNGRKLAQPWKSAGFSSCDGVSSYAVVANRNDGSVSFIQEDGDYNVAVSNGVYEPLYVNTVNGFIYVSDRTGGADRVLVFDPSDIENPATISLDIAQCDGVFHQATNGDYLAVVCVSTTNSVAVIELDDDDGEVGDVTYINLENLGDSEPMVVFLSLCNT